MEGGGSTGKLDVSEKTSSSSSITEEQPHNDGDARSIAESIGNQRRLLSKSRLLVAFPALALCLFVSFIDQTSVSTSIPAVSADLNTGTATSWIGASFLISSVSFQLINGRLSDIFGRKNLLLACLLILALGDLLAGFAKTSTQLFAFRALAGIGGGGINSIVMIIVSDITTLQNRGKYQGILGAVLALANGTGPFVGGALVEKASWRYVFWIVPMLALPAALVILFFLPLRHDKGDYVAKFKKIDYGGIVINLAAVLLILIPLTGGGVTYSWASAEFIVMVVLGGVLAIAFVLYEWKFAPIPIMPLRLYQAPHCTFLYAQSFFSGLNFYGNFFYLPIYFQSVRLYSPIQSGALMLPLVICTSITSILSGQFMNRICLYMPSVAVGFGLWTLGAGLRCMFKQNTSLGVIIVTLLIEGCGVGLTLQPTLVGLYANSKTGDRAVVTGLRNFIRTMGGAFGLVASGAILSNNLQAKLSTVPTVTVAAIEDMSSRIAQRGTLASRDDEDSVISAYMTGIHWIFIFYACSAGVNFLLSVGIGNTSLKKKEEPAAASRVAREEEDANGVVISGEEPEETFTSAGPARKTEEV